MANESFVFELGERPSAARINDALCAVIKEQVRAFIAAGHSIDEANVHLNEVLIPQMNAWLERGGKPLH